jgi:hypothetical protein
MRTARKKGKRLERRERQTKAKPLLKIQEVLVRVKEEASRHIMNMPANIVRCRESAQSEKHRISVVGKKCNAVCS